MFHSNLDFLFLALSLFIPRLTLLIYHFLMPHLFPPNAVPLIGDIALGIFLPRVLILIYIYTNMGAANIWFVLHLVVAVAVYFGSSRAGLRRRQRGG